VNIVRIFIPKTVHVRLLWAALIVQVAVLLLFIVSGTRFLQETLLTQADNCVQRMSPVLISALLSPMAQEDTTTVQTILQSVKAAPGVVYLAVIDHEGRLVAQAGWPEGQALPAATAKNALLEGGVLPRVDVVEALGLSGQSLGSLHFGLDLAYINRVSAELLQRAVYVALWSLLLTLLFMSLIGLWLSRKFARLIAASEAVEGGGFDLAPLDEGRDELGRVGMAFNAMVKTLRTRMDDLISAREAVFLEKEQAQVTLSSIGDGVISFDLDGRVDFLNPAAEELTGWPLAEARGLHAQEVFSLIDSVSTESLENPVLRCLREGTMARLDENVLLQTRDGRQVYVSDTVAPIRDAQGKLRGVVLAFQDVSTKREMLAEMHWQANHDSLTGLMNRRSFEAQLRQLLNIELGDGHAGDVELGHALLYIDLDQFKIVNDTSGHLAGDELLRQVTFLMRQSLRQTDVFARLGGDEFGVLLLNCHEERVLEIANALREAIHDFRFVWRDKAFQIGVSIGVVMLKHNMHSTTEVLSAADMACYAAKEAGRNRVHIYRADDALTLNRRTEMLVASGLREAMRENRFVLFVQEIHAMNPVQGQQGIRYFEVLLRLRDVNGEIMPADSFIPAAERYGVMPQIDRWVVRHALRQAATICASGHVHIAINLSGLSMLDPQMSDFIRHEILANNIDPRLICFEITETAVISFLSQGVEFMQELISLGCQFALDDFGSGMSSFGYLKTLPVHCIKIDGAFVRDMLNDPLDRTLVETIHHIGKVMGMQTVAEYATSEAHVVALREVGVDFVQGFALSKPQPMRDVFGEIAQSQTQSLLPLPTLPPTSVQ
jgi:diguanylate cyclase (GGDEF)-like protein/PAS domain S-box-containing protein